MTKRECRRIAQKIADLELQLQKSTDENEKHKIQNKILKICSSFTDIEAMMQIDEMVQNIIQSS